MSFELGLACSLDRHNSPHTYIILERKSYRLDRTLSNIKASNPYVYKRTMLVTIHCILDALGKEWPQPDIKRVYRLAKDLCEIADEIKTNNRFETIFNRTLTSGIYTMARTRVVIFT